MSIRPVSFNVDKNTVDVFHDEKEHGGTVDISDFVLDPSNMYVSIQCPVCPSLSVHPIGGGAAPEAVQMLFILKIKEKQSLDWDQASLVVKAAVDKTDGPDRWKLEGKQESDTIENEQLSI